MRRHCGIAVVLAAERLGRIWADLEPEVAKAEVHPSIAAAIQAHNVFGLIDAALELKRSGVQAPRRVQQLAFEASVAEESWLVRKSILAAVEKGDPDDIELWAEQAKAAGEDTTQ